MHTYLVAVGSEFSFFFFLPAAVHRILSSYATNYGGAAFMAFYTSSWLLTQLIVEIGKSMSQRRRPADVLHKQLCGVTRYIPQIQVLLRRSSAREALPSGDAAGAAVFATALNLFHPLSFKIKLALRLLVCTTCFGRMYFHAHHLLDVTLGALIGTLATKALNEVIPARTFEFNHLIIFQLVFAFFYRIVKKIVAPRFKYKANAS